MRGHSRLHRCTPTLALATALALTACGGGDDRATPARAGAQSVAADVDEGHTTRHLFVPDVAHAGVLALASLEPAAGQPLATPGLDLPAAGDANLQLDSRRDELYAVSGRNVVVYSGAGALAAGALPDRAFALPAVLRTPRALWLDVDDDRLYVGGTGADGDGVILVYPSAHALRRALAKPARVLRVDGGVASLALDARRRRLYVADTAGAVRAYADADAASGRLAPATTYPVLGSGLAIDAQRDRLYVVDVFAGLIVVDHASAARAVVGAALGIDDARQVAFDAARDRLYVSARVDLYVFDNAGTITPSTAVPAPAWLPVAGAVLGGVAFR